MVNKNIFITGATGFIGKNLALRLVEKNRVYALVRPESVKKTAGLRKEGVDIVLGDLLESNSYAEIINSIDYVFHLAALFKLDAPKEELYKYNVLGTKKLLESCLNKNVKKIIHFSTAFVAGIKEKNFITECEPYPKQFKNWYEWSKVEGEKIALQFLKEYKLPIIIIRPAIVYGPGSFYGFYSALNLISKGKLIFLPGNGRNKVHLIHVDDVVNAVIYLAESQGEIGLIYHVCDDKAYTSSELIKMVCKELKVRLPFLLLPRFLVKNLIRISFCKAFFNEISPRLLDYFLYNQSYDNRKLRDTNYLLKYPTVVEGFKATIDWYRKNGYLN